MQDKNTTSGVIRLKHNSPITQKSLKTSSYVQQVTSFEPPVSCHKHCNDNINYICIDCRYKCLCGSCIQQDAHSTHHLKSVSKGSSLISTALKQALIRLRSKSDLLTNLKDDIKITKSQIFHEYSQYERSFNINFDSLASDLAMKKLEITELIYNYHQQISHKLDILVNEINQQSVLTLEMIHVVQQNFDKHKQYPTSLCLFYQNYNIQIENMVDGASDRLKQFKKKIPEIEWILEFDIFDKLKQQVKSLGLVTNNCSIYLNCCFVDPKKYQAKKVQNKLEIVKSGMISGFRTPKNQESHKIVFNNFKSPSNTNKKSKGKLNSMPASSSKQKTPKKKSPNKIKIQQKQINKKFKKYKK